MLSKIEEAKREEGFTLIELLVVVIIIGILAAIAIPVFLNQRTKARESAVESTLRSAATYMEIYYTENNGYNATVAQLEGIGFRSGEKVNVTDANSAADATLQAWCMEASHDDDPAVAGRFDSTVGSPELYATCAP